MVNILAYGNDDLFGAYGYISILFRLFMSMSTLIYLFVQLESVINYVDKDKWGDIASLVVIIYNIFTSSHLFSVIIADIAMTWSLDKFIASKGNSFYFVFSTLGFFANIAFLHSSDGIIEETMEALFAMNAVTFVCGFPILCGFL